MVHIPPNPDASPNNFIGAFLYQINPDVSDSTRCDQLYNYAMQTGRHEPRPSSDAMMIFLDDLESGEFNAICGNSVLTRRTTLTELKNTLMDTYPAILEKMNSRLSYLSIADLDATTPENAFEVRQELTQTASLLVMMNSDKATDVMKWHVLNNPNYFAVRMMTAALETRPPEKVVPFLCDVVDGKLHEKKSKNPVIEAISKFIYNGRAVLAADAIAGTLINNENIGFATGAKALFCLTEAAVTADDNRVKKSAVKNLLIYAASLYKLDSVCESLGRCCL